MNSAAGVAQRGFAEAGQPAVLAVPAGTVEVVPIRALLLGERLDTRALERDKPLGVAPLTVEIPGGGVAVLFRYGAIVLFGVATTATDNFVASLRTSIIGALGALEQDEARHPELERLYMRLAEEYELRDRDRAVDRKLDIVSRTVETLLGLVQTRSSMRVEWYIVLLIIAELLLTTYPLLLHR